MVAIKMLGLFVASMFLLFRFFNLLHLIPWHLEVKPVHRFRILLTMSIAYSGHLALSVFWRLGQVLQI
ncbi:hypothetical protein [Aetokthonos hydrillicola]|uniref:hypothetical protein n=1 Tax=Aetokthonos hydrillicola TaxID=1550245 RepID=UPI0030DA9478